MNIKKMPFSPLEIVKYELVIKITVWEYESDYAPLAAWSSDPLVELSFSAGWVEMHALSWKNKVKTKKLNDCCLKRGWSWCNKMLVCGSLTLAGENSLNKELRLTTRFSSLFISFGLLRLCACLSVSILHSLVPLSFLYLFSQPISVSVVLSICPSESLLCLSSHSKLTLLISGVWTFLFPDFQSPIGWT